jgi:hypothetical protein
LPAESYQQQCPSTKSLLVQPLPCLPAHGWAGKGRASARAAARLPAAGSDDPASCHWPFLAMLG